jgi:hypothetical protein
MESIIRDLQEKRGCKTIKRPDKVIKIEVHFWTDGIVPPDKEKRIPKVAWDFGTIHILKNEGHGIRRSKPIHYNNLSELQATIEKAFAERGIRLIHSQKYGTPYYP